MLSEKQLVINAALRSDYNNETGNREDHVIISFSDSQEPVVIEQDRFFESIELTKVQISKHDSENHSSEPIASRLKNIIGLIQSHIHTGSLNLAGTLFVESNDCVLLDLPWEQILGLKNRPVIRKYSSGDVKDLVHCANFLFLMSHACKSQHLPLSNINEGIFNEIENIFSLVPTLKRRESPSKIKVNNVHLLQHTTSSSFSETRFQDYDIMHVAMHGISSGSLVFETPDDYKQGHITETSQLVEELRGRNFKFIFFSTCYSGGLTTKEKSLCSELISEGITDCVVGYNQKSGDRTAVSIANDFYTRLCDSEHISTEVLIRVFSETIEKIAPDKYEPVMYIR